MCGDVQCHVEQPAVAKRLFGACQRVRTIAIEDFSAPAGRSKPEGYWCQFAASSRDNHCQLREEESRSLIVVSFQLPLGLATQGKVLSLLR